MMFAYTHTHTWSIRRPEYDKKKEFSDFNSSCFYDFIKLKLNRVDIFSIFLRSETFEIMAIFVAIENKTNILNFETTKITVRCGKKSTNELTWRLRFFPNH